MPPSFEQQNPVPPAVVPTPKNKQRISLITVVAVVMIAILAAAAALAYNFHILPPLVLKTEMATSTPQDSNENGMPFQSKWVSWQQISSEKDSCRISNPQNGEMFLEEIYADNYSSHTTALVTQFPHSDLETFVFQVTANGNSLCGSDFQSQFAKDKNRVYWYANEYFGEGHDSMDTNYAPPVYKTKVDDHRYYNAVVVNADPATFEVLSDQWAKDKDHAYGFGNKFITIAGADSATFSALPGGWGKDEKYVYKLQDDKVIVIDGIDGGTFTYLGDVKTNDGDLIFKDTHHIYYELVDNRGMGSTGDYWLLPINGINPTEFDVASFVDLNGGPVYKDRSHVYVMTFVNNTLLSLTTIKQDVDINTLECLYTDVCKDKNHVYQLLNNQSPASMSIIGQGLVDPITLTFVGFGSKDGTYVFKDKDHIYQYSGGVFTVLPATSNT